MTLPTIPSLSRIVSLSELQGVLSAWEETITVILQNAPDGTVSAPGISFTGNQTTGIRMTTDGGIVLVANGVDIFTISGSGTVNFTVNPSGEYSNQLTGMSLDRSLYGLMITPTMFGAIGDGASHQLSTVTQFFGVSTAGYTLAQWQGIFPRATALTQEIDYLAHDAALQVSDRVYVPPGQYVLGANTLTLPTRDGVHLIGAGKTCTQWISTSATGDIIAFAPGNYNGQEVSFGTITSTVQKTSGNAILIPGGHGHRSISIVLGYNLYVGYGLYAHYTQFNYWIEDFEINSGTFGFVVGDGDSTTVVQNLWVKNGIVYNTTSAAFQLINLSGGYFDDIDNGSCGNGYAFAPASGQEVVACDFRNTGADTTTGSAYYCDKPTGYVARIVLDNAWASNCGKGNSNAGILFNGGTNVNCRDLIINSPYADHCGGPGISIVNFESVSMSNITAIGNSITTPSTYDGIYLDTNHVSIIGGNVGSGGVYDNETQRFGIFISSDTTYYAISGVHFSSGDNAGAVSNGGTYGTISNCSGYRLKDSGTITMPKGQTTVTVNTKMNVGVDILRTFITSNGPLSNVGGAAWPLQASGSQFTLAVSSAPTADIGFGWLVDMETT
ncbi:hypothetical protein [Gluconobacter wancherniae]|uniref:hypothetical protein n=1 Tax=Gluconobacter wancherniae TaxID=1307955 RepID=UPI001B8BC05E|nr:hypothetical protein [Gluconobacter wancherniae]MBS1093837.1 hypothetical protein [Gluconobacter wancherniae]